MVTCTSYPVQFRSPKANEPFISLSAIIDQLIHTTVGDGIDSNQKQETDVLQVCTMIFKVSVKLNLGVWLKLLVFANCESGGCEVPVYFRETKCEKLILKQLKSLFIVSRVNLRAKNIRHIMLITCERIRC